MSTTTALAVGAVLGVLLTFAVSACAVGLIFLVGRRNDQRRREAERAVERRLRAVAKDRHPATQALVVSGASVIPFPKEHRP